MSDNLNKVITQIQAIMSRTKEAGFNEAEVLQANEKVLALLAKHNLDRDAVLAHGKKADDPIVMNDTCITELNPWHMFVGSGVSKLYCVGYFRANVIVRGLRDKPTMKGAHVFVGTQANTTVAAMMFDYLVKAVDRAARDGAASLSKSEQSPYRTTFRSSCAARLDVRMMEKTRAAMKGELAEVNDKGEKTGRNLPALIGMFQKQKAAVDEFMKENVGKMKTQKMRVVDLNAEAKADGIAAGNRISLDAQVGSGRATTAIADTKQITKR